MNIGRRGFLGLLSGLAAWAVAKPLRLLAPRDLDSTLIAGKNAIVFTNFEGVPESIPVNFKDIVIGQWADYWPPEQVQTGPEEPIWSEDPKRLTQDGPIGWKVSLNAGTASGELNRRFKL